MEHLIPFLIANWPLSLTALLLIIIIFVLEIRNLSRGVTMVSPNKAAIIMNKKNCQIIDVRSPEAFNNGHIKKSKNITLEQLKADEALLKSKADSILLVCDNGMNSKKTGAFLKSKGFEQVFAIEGGLNQWRKENYPLTKSEA